MNTAPNPTTLEELLKFVYNVEVENDVKLIPTKDSEQDNATFLPIGIFEMMVKDFECYRTEAEEVLTKYDESIHGDFIGYIHEKLSFIPIAAWSETGMFVTPFTVTAPARVKEVSMAPTPLIESKRKLINLLTHHLRETREVRQESKALELDKQKYKNPTIHMVGEIWLVVREDGKNSYIADEKGNEILADNIALTPLEYQLALTAAKLERQVLWLREKYEPQSIDWDKEPSHGISQWAYESGAENKNEE